VPQSVKTLTILDVTVPGIGPDISQGGKRWHHAFHMTPELPEALGKALASSGPTVIAVEEGEAAAR